MSSDDDTESVDTTHTRPPGFGPRRGRRPAKQSAPAWKYFEPCPTPERTSGRDTARGPYFKCRFCRNYSTPNPTRAKQHLLGNIVKGDAPACLGLYGIIELADINDMYATIKVPRNVSYMGRDGKHILIPIRGRTTSVSTPNSEASIHGSNHFQTDNNTDTEGRVRATSLSNPIKDAYQVPHRERFDKLWANAFFASGIPFNVAENPWFREAVHETAKGLVNGYSLPKSIQLREGLLKESREDLKMKLQKSMKEAKPYGYTLSSDGWENVRREPLMNIMLLTSKGEFFLDSWNAAQADKKDGRYLGMMWLKYIEQIGADRVIHIVTDGAPANRVGGCDIVMAKYPHITWSWCAAHVFDLLLEDMIGNRKIVVDEIGHNPFKEVFEKLRWIVKAVSKSQRLSAIFVRKSPQKKLLNPNATRFATNFLMAQRALELRGALQEMVIDDGWQAYRSRLPSHPRSRGHMTNGKAQELKQWIQDDDFWVRVKATVDFFIPLVKLLREFDGSAPQSAWLYWSLKRGMRELEESMQACSLVSEYLKPKIRQAYMERKKSLTTDFMLAAAYMNPHMFFDEEEDVAGNGELAEGFRTYIGRYAEHYVPAGPNHDRDVAEFVALLQYQAVEAQKKLSNTSVARIPAQEQRDKYTPAEWWHTFGYSYPELRLMARKILHQKMCASACERNWSAYGFIHSKLRNRLTNDRAKDLVYVFTNMRVEKGLTKVRNPHTSIYKRFYERQARNDAPGPISTENCTDGDNAPHADFREDDFDDFDNIDDADEELQGLSLDGRDEFLTRIPAYYHDSEGLEDDMDPDQYPTIDESQAPEDEYLDQGRDTSQQHNFRINESAVDGNRAESSQQRRGVEVSQSGALGRDLLRESNHTHYSHRMNPYARGNRPTSGPSMVPSYGAPIFGETSSFARSQFQPDAHESNADLWGQQQEDVFQEEQARRLQRNRNYSSQ